ncbi:MAG: hypothetical protein A3I11_00010 [Elusimicrobia bacterium RIFCSPLOWO2_02_FULL_39_32]|nr:MAG: hypothetical protein A2034_08085 [Elusimicrobia bacterium GWA2_38_7]OGR80408.1 MAG: hypothetical protein A3B80_04440 [Elusimicrobia bacterium RIFCSPHIGHO2_02_FULL_39_36]OGR93290.1 MAG: hypothetical protein A3I11_00010 [Elusimicrobia bacterium RIFCSPLOWO2_02_FULL_39_32]OGS00520.1 MAG: hypothetical protein A3G85_00410 [Elusimicrobia bacterium RIFCSPLOWO2_12_FULL_39_28]
MAKKQLSKSKNTNYGLLLNRIGEIIVGARRHVVRTIDTAQVFAYWQIGMAIVRHEQQGKVRAAYGQQTLIRLSQDLINRFGRGFSIDNLQNMRKIYISFPKLFKIYETVSRKLRHGKEFKKYETLSRILSWSHYCELQKEENKFARSFYERETIENNWSVRELKRQMNSMLFERLALSLNKKKVLSLAKKGQVIVTPEDSIKDPYVLEFLGLKENSIYTETQLEQALIDKLQIFLLELGKGFTFVARQKRITIANRHYHIDLVFYNRFLKCFVLVDLKSGELDHADFGQMNFYLNYFKNNEKGIDENDPIGLILCAKKDEVFAKYVLGGVNNKIFASKYRLTLPSEKTLHSQLMLKHKI